MTLLERLARPATEVAPELLGAVLHGRGVSLRLTEVEAYLGPDDPGSHAYRGPTARNATMFGPPGRLYVYRSYGIHACVNLVCGTRGFATGALLRAGEVVSGVELARERRPTARRDVELARGPGRLSLALGLTLDDDGIALGDDGITLELPEHPVPAMTGPRVGVSGVAGTDEYPWRFWIPGDPTVSVYRPATSRRRPSAAPR